VLPPVQLVDPAAAINCTGKRVGKTFAVPHQDFCFVLYERPEGIFNLERWLSTA
jgi:hypothetical protein